MADTKITALAAIATVDPAADVLPIVDISDTSMAPSGTTKKVTTNQILQAGGTATLASATITGALTSGTTTLVSHAAGYTGKVGIGTATPGETLDVKGTGNFNNTSGTYLGFQTNAAQVGYIGTANTIITGGLNTELGLWANSSLVIATGASALQRLRVEAAGDVTVSTGNVVMATSGKGIDFSATASGSGTMTSELLNDYEEGTWSPTPSGNVNLTSVVSVSARYTKVGRLVTLSGHVTATVTLPNIVTYFVLPSLPFANNGTTTGAVQENNNLNVGAVQVASSNLYGFFPAASAIVSGAATFYYSVTYSV